MYEFENIIYEEPPMPKIGEKDLHNRKVMTEEGKCNSNNIILFIYKNAITNFYKELFGFDKLFVNEII